MRHATHRPAALSQTYKFAPVANTLQANKAQKEFMGCMLSFLSLRRRAIALPEVGEVTVQVAGFHKGVNGGESLGPNRFYIPREDLIGRDRLLLGNCGGLKETKRAENDDWQEPRLLGQAASTLSERCYTRGGNGP